MFDFLPRWREDSRRIRATEGEWQWCKRCDRLTQNWYRTVVRNVKTLAGWQAERERRPICSVCLDWKPRSE